MKCPKCEEEMISGELFNPAGRGGLFWAPTEYFNSKIGNFFTFKGAKKEGGISIPIRGGVINNRTKGYACKECKFVLIDCN